MEEFADMPEVEDVQPNYLYTADEAYAANAEEKGPDLAERDQAGQMEAVSPRLQKAEDPLLKKQWNLEYIHAQEAWDKIDRLKKAGKLKNTEKVIIASLDTGIDLQQEITMI